MRGIFLKFFLDLRKERESCQIWQILRDLLPQAKQEFLDAFFRFCSIYFSD